MIFGHLRTSSNYKKNKKTGGKNGYGAKLTNIFSEHFIVDTMYYDRNKNITTHFK